MSLRAHIYRAAEGSRYWVGRVEDRVGNFVWECSHRHVLTATAEHCAQNEVVRRNRARRSKGGSPR